MKNSDSEFKDWLMGYRGELKKEVQKETVDNAIKAMDDPRPFCWWVEEECYKLRTELMASFPADRSKMKSVALQGNVMMVIKNRWDSIVRNRVAELNPPQGAGKANP